MLPTLDSILDVLTACQEGAAGSGAGGCEQSSENLAMDAGESRAGARAEDGAGPITGVRALPGASAGVGTGEADAVGGGARGGGQGAYLWSRTTLFRALQDIGFTFSKGPNHYDVAREKPSLSRQREDFIDTLRQYRASGKVTYYTDETWANKNMSVYRSWNDGNLRSRLEQPSGKGGSIIIDHVGSRETGLLQGAGLSFVGKKSTGDYDKKMNGPTWLKWLEIDVFPKISDCVLVIDRAPYHLTLTDDARPATTKMKKAEFAEWLVRHDAVPPSCLSQDCRKLKTMADMEAEADKHRPAPRYQVQDLARRFNVKNLISPVDRPELNPIEIVWKTVKMALKRANVEFTMAALKSLVDNEFAKITANVWCRYEDHAINMEEWYCHVEPMREEVEAAFEKAVEEAERLEEDEVNSEPFSGLDVDDMAMSDDE